MYENEMKAMLEAVKEAAKHIMKVYESDFEVEIKSDDSPVTLADKGADKILRDYLSARFPDYGFLTEESKDTGERKKHRAIFIIDPVDGTSDFVAKDGQFCTNVALAVDHQVVAGVIHLPASGISYCAIKGQGAYRLEPGKEPVCLHVSSRRDHLRAMRSISHFKKEEEEFYETHRSFFEEEIEPVGAAYKFCLIAEGKKEFFIRISGGTKEWDVAPGDLLLSESGGIMTKPNGETFTYNRDDVYNRDGYVMANSRENLFLK